MESITTGPQTRGYQYNLSNILQAPSSTPCGLCSSIVPKWKSCPSTSAEYAYIETGYQLLDKYPTFPVLRLSADNGCALCGLIHKALSSLCSADTRPRHDRSIGNENQIHPFWKDEESGDGILALEWDRSISISAIFQYDFPRSCIDGMVPVRVVEDNTRGGMITALKFRWGPTCGIVRDAHGASWSASILDCQIYDSVDLESTNHELKRRIPGVSTISNNNVVMMKNWISVCTSSHKECSFSGQSWLPTRLLEINQTPESQSIRLVETSTSLPIKGSQYAALSHVWGDMTVSPPLRTTTANIGQHFHNISLDDLPRNFTDATRVCIALGIRYLWIDSLCIIQDSAEDWKDEAVLMHLVYRHALVTIAATSATSSHDGFLQRSLDAISAVKVAYASGDGSSGASKPGQSYFIASWSDRPGDRHRLFSVDCSKWNTRGWTLQERSLSTRIIHFCRNKIFYECRESLWSEENETASELDVSISPFWPRRSDMSHDELYQRWELVLVLYSTRNLTRGADKLIAIESIAQEMKMTTKEEYIRFAGMWRPNISKDLLWYRGIGGLSRPDHYRAPSWSWASVDGQPISNNIILTNKPRSVPKELSALLLRYPFEVMGLGEHYPSSVPTSIINYIEIRTLVKRVSVMKRVTPVEESQRIDRSSQYFWRGFFAHDVFTDNWGDQNTQPPRERGPFAYGRLDIDDERDITGNGEALIYAHVDVVGRATGLLLESSSKSKGADGFPRVWRRVGVASLFVDRTGKVLLGNVFDNESPQHIVII